MTVFHELYMHHSAQQRQMTVATLTLNMRKDFCLDSDVDFTVISKLSIVELRYFVAR